MTARSGEARAFLDSVLAMPSWPAECIDWQFSRVKGGYGKVWIAGRIAACHVLACERRNGPRPDGMQARHLCGRGASGCFNPAHLEWGTPAVNQHDRVPHDTHGRGERCGTHKLTEDEVRQIRRMWVGRGGPSQQSIGDQFGVSAAQVNAVIHGRNWGWLS